jgi:hypothetical protein
MWSIEKSGTKAMSYTNASYREMHQILVMLATIGNTTLSNQGELNID